MRIPSLCATGLLILAVAALSGCVWLRLLDLKGQFEDFDRYITVPPGPGIELRFNHPVLLDEDLAFLIKSKPTARAEAGGISVRIYAFRHVASAAGPDPQTAATALQLAVGVRDGRIFFVSLPAEVFQVIPREIALRGMRAIGRAEVDRTNRSATAAVDLAGITAQLPTRVELIALFGQPNQVTSDAGQQRLLWRFQLQGESLRSDGKPVVAAVAFVFAPEEERPRRFQANISGMWLYLDLPRPVAPAHP